MVTLIHILMDVFANILLFREKKKKKRIFLKKEAKKRNFERKEEKETEWHARCMDVCVSGKGERVDIFVCFVWWSE